MGKRPPPGNAALAKAIAFAMRCPWAKKPAGTPKRSGQRPPRPRRALLARRVGRWPTRDYDPTVPGGDPRARAGETYTFPCPARLRRGCAGAAGAVFRAENGTKPARALSADCARNPSPSARGALYLSRDLGEGHRLRHVLPCPPDRPGRQSVPASARPAPGGRFSPAGSGAGLSGFPIRPLPGATAAHGRGKRIRFLVPPGPSRGAFGMTATAPRH